MSYKSLVDVFYADSSADRFNNVDRLARERLMAESTFRTGIETPTGELFLAVPRELSLLNEKVLRYERRISRLRSDLPAVADAALVRKLVVDEVVSTNSLEGVHSTRRQISEVLSAVERNRSQGETRRFREFVNLYLGISDPGRSFPKTPEDIRAVYDRVMRGEDLGDDAPDGRLFRRGEVEVIGTGGKVLHRGLYPESAIVKGLEQMLSIVESRDIPETYSAIVGHYVFEYVHPFYDGNGRTGRYLLALYLSRPLSMLTSLSLSRVLAENRASYYRSFKKAEHPKNYAELTSFVMNVLESVHVAQAELDTALQTSRDLLREAESRLDSVRESEGLSEKEAGVLYLLVQIALFAAFPEATLAEVASYSRVGTQQARKYTKALVERGLVDMKRSRELHFALSEGARMRLGLSADGQSALDEL